MSSGREYTPSSLLSEDIDLAFAWEERKALDQAHEAREQRIQDAEAYARTRPYEDVAGIHDPHSGEVVDPTTYHKQQRELHYEGTHQPYDQMSSDDLFEKLLNAEVRKDKTTLINVSEELRANFANHKIKYAKLAKMLAEAEFCESDAAIEVINEALNNKFTADHNKNLSSPNNANRTKMLRAQVMKIKDAELASLQDVREREIDEEIAIIKEQEAKAKRAEPEAEEPAKEAQPAEDEAEVVTAEPVEEPAEPIIVTVDEPEEVDGSARIVIEPEEDELAPKTPVTPEEPVKAEVENNHEVLVRRLVKFKSNEDENAQHAWEYSGTGTLDESYFSGRQVIVITKSGRIMSALDDVVVSVGEETACGLDDDDKLDVKFGQPWDLNVWSENDPVGRVLFNDVAEADRHSERVIELDEEDPFALTAELHSMVRSSEPQAPEVQDQPPAPQVSPEAVAEVVDEMQKFNKKLQDDKLFVPSPEQYDEMVALAKKIDIEHQRDVSGHTEYSIRYMIGGERVSAATARTFLDNVQANKWLLTADDADRAQAALMSKESDAHEALRGGAQATTVNWGLERATDLLNYPAFDRIFQRQHLSKVKKAAGEPLGKVFAEYKSHVEKREKLSEHIGRALEARGEEVIEPEVILKRGLDKFVKSTKATRTKRPKNPEQNTRRQRVTKLARQLGSSAVEPSKESRTNRIKTGASRVAQLLREQMNRRNKAEDEEADN